MVSEANDDDLLVGEGLPSPVGVAQLVEALGDLPVGTGLEQFVHLADDFGKGLADQRNGLGLIDLE